ncbi:hypothetical protein PV08_08380 [Exophiala spinifera]|uniref:Transcription factor domain-containing protein n=1 Tax=Exophiala spinifera TaxID=91928 RepID=A0A0D2B2N5_9EURO|nr:uncharacterized protein PV08_08380 [Exophiala spinifera]KIW13193.1 hypothetical protein PV08_08380 [Exophiala spinifera]
MFVPYNGETQRFNVRVSDQRRHSAKAFQRRRRENAIRFKQHPDTEIIGSPASTQISSTSPTSSELLSTDDESNDYDDQDVEEIATATLEHQPPVSTSTTTRSNAGDTPDNGDHQPQQLGHDQSMTLSVTHKLRAISRSDMTFGGFRVDPFRSYPIKWREYFPAVTDFCRIVVAPRPNYFQFVMENDVLFEAIVTYCLCVMPATTPQTQMALMYHYGGTMSKVSRFLSSGSKEASDAVILAICNLAVICAYRGDDEHFQTHLDGIHQLIKLRGGKDAFETEGSWVNMALIAIEALALVPSRKQPRTATVETTLTEVESKPTIHISSRTPVYPEHPFSAELCALISRLPEGFREVALTGRVSIQLINRLEITRSQVVHLMATATDDERDRDWQALMLASSPLERMGWFAVLVFHLRSSTHYDNCKSLAKAVLECAQQRYYTVAENEWILWGACLLIATPDPERVLTAQRHNIIAWLKRRKALLSYPRMNAIANKFLWSDGLSDGLRTIIMDRLTS